MELAPGTLGEAVQEALDRGFIEAADIVDGDLRVSSSTRRNLNLRIERRRRPGFLIKRPGVATAQPPPRRWRARRASTDSAPTSPRRQPSRRSCRPWSMLALRTEIWSSSSCGELERPGRSIRITALPSFRRSRRESSVGSSGSSTAPSRPVRKPRLPFRPSCALSHQPTSSCTSRVSSCCER